MNGFNTQLTSLVLNCLAKKNERQRQAVREQICLSTQERTLIDQTREQEKKEALAQMGWTPSVTITELPDEQNQISTPLKSKFVNKNVEYHQLPFLFFAFENILLTVNSWGNIRLLIHILYSIFRANTMFTSVYRPVHKFYATITIIGSFGIQTLEIARGSSKYAHI